MRNQEEPDYSTYPSPQADVMPTETFNTPSLRTGNMEEGICVRRSALEDDEDKAREKLEPEVEKALRARLAELFEPLQAVSPERVSASDHQSDEHEFEFRMFSGGAHKMVLREDEGIGDGAFVKLRDPRIFVVPRAVGQRKVELDHMAMTGEEILEGSKRRAWALEVPWRVKILKFEGSRTSQTTNITFKVAKPITGGNKTKPNKKRRILLRERTKQAEELARRIKLEEQSREEAEREKKSRKNRDKKLKRRAKEKASKAAGAGTEELSG